MGLYLGLISGTSMDAIDAALVDFDLLPLSLRAASATPFEPELKARIAAIIDSPEAVSLDEIGQIDVAVAQAFARCALQLLREAGVAASAVSAIGSHGQTLRAPAGPAPALHLAGGRSECAQRNDRHHGDR